MRAIRSRLCLIEDDEIMGESLCERFELEGFAHDWHRSCAEAEIALERHHYAAVVSDIRLPDRDGGDLFLALKQRGLSMPPWIFITGHGAVDRAVALLKAGAADYVTKPFDLDALVERLTLMLNQSAAVEEDGRLGVSAAMEHVQNLLPRLATQASTVLISGESGVGKEVVARELHRIASTGRSSPFIAVKCGAISEGLMEAELFGHERGAFTGAVKERPGVFEQAHGGTLFLDEIGDMPLAMQVKLLRAIQERKVTRVGGDRAIGVDFRLICATHRDLREMVEEGAFREDLFYRINVINLRLPPLRERGEDVLWLARRFLAAHARAHPEEPKRLTPTIEQALLMHAWPGNVRELKNAIERACILSVGDELQLETLFEVPPPGELLEGVTAAGLADYLRACEREYIKQALETNEGQIARTAARLGISRKNLWERMKRLDLSAG